MSTRKPGDNASRTLTVGDEVIRAFADPIGDHNPIHLDDNYACTTRFDRRIANGMIAAGLISATLANERRDRAMSTLANGCNSRHRSTRAIRSQPL